MHDSYFLLKTLWRMDTTDKVVLREIAEKPFILTRGWQLRLKTMDPLIEVRLMEMGFVQS